MRTRFLEEEVELCGDHFPPQAEALDPSKRASQAEFTDSRTLLEAQFGIGDFSASVAIS